MLIYPEDETIPNGLAAETGSIERSGEEGAEVRAAAVHLRMNGRERRPQDEDESEKSSRHRPSNAGRGGEGSESTREREGGRERLVVVSCMERWVRED